jgi:hypothetical protein
MPGRASLNRPVIDTGDVLDRAKQILVDGDADPAD